jgi:hypothetical protein
MYDEIVGAERLAFEAHLSGCEICTDDFAGISNARFAVYEWQKEEFAHLQTPHILVPYEAEATTGVLAALRGLTSLLSWPTFAAAATAVVICLGIGFVLINNSRSGDQQVVQNEVPNVSERPVNDIPLIETPTKTESSPQLPLNEYAKGPVPRTVAAAARTHARRPSTSLLAVRNASPSRFTNRAVAKLQLRPPALTAYTDDEDVSLRLADLLDEIGKSP